MAQVAGSTSIVRSASAPSPATRQAFSTDECVWLEVYTVSGAGRRPGARGAPAAGPVQRGQQGDQRGVGGGVLDDAAARAVGAEPVRQVEQLGQPVEHVRLQLGGRGQVAQSMPCTPRPDESRSPRIAGPEALAGK